MIICKRCNKEFEEFITKKGKNSTKCHRCLEDKNRQNTERHHRIMREYYSEHKQKYKEMRFKNALKRKYGITPDEYQQMWNLQDGKCEICKIQFIRSSEWGKPKKTQACVDHNHITGKVRSLLCRGCNLKLEIIDNNNFLEKAIQYLSKFKM